MIEQNKQEIKKKRHKEKTPQNSKRKTIIKTEETSILTILKCNLKEFQVLGRREIDQKTLKLWEISSSKLGEKRAIRERRRTRIGQYRDCMCGYKVKTE